MNDRLSLIRQQEQSPRQALPDKQDYYPLLGTSIMDQLPGQVTVQRETSDSMVTATLDTGREITTSVRTPLQYLNQMTEHLFAQSGFSIHANYSGKKAKFDLANVITEDMGHAIGTGMKHLLRQKQQEGINQHGSSLAGTNLQRLNDSVFIAINVEAKKDFQLICPDDRDEVHHIVQWDVEDTSSQALRSILMGLAAGLKAQISIYPLSGSDPHHIWEAIFRGLGSAIQNIRKNPVHPQTQLANQKAKKQNQPCYQIVEQTLNIVTSQDLPNLMVCIESAPRRKYDLDSGSVYINHLIEQIGIYSSLNIDINAHDLPPADIGKTLGIALTHIGLGPTGIDIGVNGEAAALVCIDCNEKPGLIFSAFKSTIQREAVLAGVENDTRRVDLDDFYQAIAQSMGASINIFVIQNDNGDKIWDQIHKAFALTIKQVFKSNPYLAGTTSEV